MSQLYIIVVDTGSGGTQLERGAVSEWFKVTVLKTVVQQCTVGSNPTRSERYTGEGVVPEWPKGAVC